MCLCVLELKAFAQQEPTSSKHVTTVIPAKFSDARVQPPAKIGSAHSPPAKMAAVTTSSTLDIRSSPPPRKRIRVDSAASEQKSVKEPRLFAPFRALGLVTNHIPFVLQARSFKGATEGPRIHLLTCLGRAWALWEGGKMGLLFVGE